MSLEGKRVLVTLPLEDEEYQDFTSLVESAGGTVAFKREMVVREEDVAGVAAIVGNVPARMLHAPAELEWLQTSSAGYDHYLTQGTLAGRTLLSNATGAYGQAVSEHMFAQLLCMMKKLHRYRDNQAQSSWRDEGSVRSLVGAYVLVLGAGDIGTSFARLCVAMGATACGLRRTRVEASEPFARMATFDELYELLPWADVVACVVPSAPSTRGLADERFFAAMREGSYFLNAGRGDLVVQDDLVAAVHSGHLAGAALDVTAPEPLDQESPLWTERDILVTPHVAGFWHLRATRDAVVRICRENLAAFAAGEPLANLVRG